MPRVRGLSSVVGQTRVRCGLPSASMRTRSRVSAPSPNSGAGLCSSSTSEGPVPGGELAPDAPCGLSDGGDASGLGYDGQVARRNSSGHPDASARRLRAKPAGYRQNRSSTISSPSGGKSDGEAGVRISIGTILASLLLSYPCSILAWRSPVGRPARFMVAGRRRKRRSRSAPGKGLVHAVAGSPRESRPRPVRRAAMPRAVWLFTAPQLMPIAAATSASERSA